MRASGIIKFGPAGSFRLVGWLTLSWLAASAMTGFAVVGQSADLLTACVSSGRSGRMAVLAPISLTYWETD